MGEACLPNLEYVAALGHALNFKVWERFQKLGCSVYYKYNLNFVAFCLLQQNKI